MSELSERLEEKIGWSKNTIKGSWNKNLISKDIFFSFLLSAKSKLKMAMKEAYYGGLSATVTSLMELALQVFYSIYCEEIDSFFVCFFFDKKALVLTYGGISILQGGGASDGFTVGNLITFQLYWVLSSIFFVNVRLTKRLSLEYAARCVSFHHRSIESVHESQWRSTESDKIAGKVAICRSQRRIGTGRWNR